MNKKRNSFLVKLIGLVCTLALVLGAVYVPVTLSAFAATIPVTPDETIKFSFEPAEDPAINNGSHKDRAGDDFACASWGMVVLPVDGAKAIGMEYTSAWKQAGGYRLNNSNGVYRLDESSRYVVRFKLSLRSAPTPEEVAARGTNAYIKLGYGFTGGPASSTGNQVKTMDAVVSPVAESNGNVFTITDISGTREVTPSDKWYDLTYVFTTPADFAGMNNSFGFFAMNIAGLKFYIDEVEVTKLGTNTGVVLANDPYSGTTTVMKGTVGQDVELPTLVGSSADHTFLGWYADEERTVPVQDLKYAVETQNAYAKWRAPVTLTFSDGHNGTEQTINGYTGDAFSFPADPVDTKNDPVKYLFAGWYTTESYTQKYEETTFGSSDITVYAKWLEKEKEFIQDFEDYPYSDKVATDFGGGVINYGNWEHFATPMEKIDDPTQSGRGKVVKFEWDPNMVRDNSDPDTYDAEKEYTYRRRGSITMGDHKFVDGMQYIMYFDYYVEDIGSQTITMTTQNIWYNKGWKFVDKPLATKTHSVTADDKDGKWHTGVVLLTMEESAEAGAYIHALFRNSANDKAKVYLDNFRFVPVQINEVIMTVNNGAVAPTEYIPVEKGAALNIVPATVEGRTFKGWYSDSSCSVKFTDTVVPNFNFTVYSKWSEVPENFQNYPYSTTNIPTFGEAVSIVKGDGVGHEDNAAAKFVLDGDKIYIKDGDNITYWAARAGRDMGGHVIKLGNVVEGAVYKVSFWYKGDAAANVDSLIRLQTAHPDDCWTYGKTDTDHEAVVTPSTSEWKKMEFLYTCAPKDPAGNGLFIRFNSLGKTGDLGQLAIAYIDDILVEEIEKPFVIFDAQDGKEGTIVQGKAGEAIKVPAAPNKLGLEFAGWYLDTEFTQPFTNTVFAEDMGVRVYAKYVQASKFGESFENYSYDTTNIAIFGEAVSIIKGKGVGHEDDAAAKFVLDGDKVYKKEGKNTIYWAARAGRDMGGHVIKLGPVEEGEVYKVSFWYKGDAAANVNSLIRLQTARPDDCWSYGKTDTDHEAVVTPSTSEWKKMEFLYTCAPRDPKGNGLFIRFNSLGKTGNLDQLAIAYIDDIVVEKIQKPYVIFDAQDGKEGTIVQGKAGEKINVPKATYKLGYEFAGWYLDKEFTKPFTDTVFAENMGVIVYAKYDFANKYSESFDNYSYDTTNVDIFGKALSIVMGKGVGHEDDAAVKFEIDSNKVYDIGEDGKPIYWASRTGMDAPGHIVKIGAVEDGGVYKVSFWYKGDPAANKESWIRLATAHPDTTWHNSKTDTTSVTVTPSTEWTKAEYIFYADLKDPTSTGLYFRFATLGGANKFDVHAIAYVDDIVVEKIEKPFVIFDAQNNKLGTIVQGKAGEKIKYPATPKLVGMKFLGWYLDKEFTKPFTDTVFAEGMGITVYAKYDYANNFTVNFENVGVNRGKEDDYLFYRGGMGAVEKVGYKNSTGLFFDRTETTLWASTNALFEDGNQVIISTENKYYVTFKYCVTEQQSENGFLYLRAASPGNGWGSKHSTNKTFEDAGVICVDYPVPATAEVGKWYTAKVILDTSKIYIHTNEDGTKGDPKAFAAMYMYYRAGGGKVAVDDITFKKLPKGHQAYIVDNGGASSVPSYVSGPIGTSFRSQLPTNPQFENHLFKNYFRFDKSHNQTILEDKDMVFTKDNMNLVTNWVRLHTVQDFEDYAKLMYTYAGYGPADFDYELYDAEKEGNSADNVTSGRYSIHRLGNSPYFENIQILSDDLKICADEKFTVTMKVKVGKHFHTDGAIKLVGCKSATYAWANSGSFHPIAIIADIADGEWHEVSYTFSSVERFLAIQTPGYVEIFIDDVVIDRADPEMPVSTPPEYTEYVQALRDADGNLIKVDTTSIDVGSIIDFSLYIGGFNVLPVLLIGGGVVLVAAIVFVVLFVIKKRKIKKG